MVMVVMTRRFMVGGLWWSWGDGGYGVMVVMAMRVMMVMMVMEVMSYRGDGRLAGDGIFGAMGMTGTRKGN